jgi:hypothetical protein
MATYRSFGARYGTKLSALGLAFALLVLALVGGDASGRTATPVVPGAAQTLPPVSVLLTQRVGDFEAWKRGFDGDAEARRQASCSGHSLKRGLDDPDEVFVYCLATDVERLRAYLTSSPEAGSFILMKPVTRDLVSGRRLPGLIATQSVEDYAAWRAAYDAMDDLRRRSGIVGHAVSRGLEDPQRIVFYLQAASADDLQELAASPEFERLLATGGETGPEAEIRFIRVVDFDRYPADRS